MAQTHKIPLVECVIDRPKQTTSVPRVPEYEAVILQDIWSQVRNAKVTVRPMKQGEQLFIKSELSVERARLASKYRKDPNVQGNAPLFNRIYPGNTFDDAFEQVINGKQARPAPKMGLASGDLTPVTDAPEPEAAPNESLLVAVKGINTELASAIENELGVYTVDELAEVELQKLIDLPGIGPKSAENIKNSAQELILADAV